MVPHRQLGENRYLIMVAMRGSCGRRLMPTPSNVSIEMVYSDEGAYLPMKHVLRWLSGAETMTGGDDYFWPTRLLQEGQTVTVDGLKYILFQLSCSLMILSLTAPGNLG